MTLKVYIRLWTPPAVMQNILICVEGKLKIADLGVAHVVHGAKGSTKVQVGGWEERGGAWGRGRGNVIICLHVRGLLSLN